MVTMASGITVYVARGRVRNMAAVLKLIGNAALVYSLNLWYWTSILLSTDTCQNKVSADQYKETILQA